MASTPGGDPAYIAAHRIAVGAGLLPFEEAYPLAKLVIHDLGGPVPIGRKTITKKTAKALHDKGFVALHGVVPETWRVVPSDRVVYSEDSDRHVGTYEARALWGGGTRAKMWVLATQEGVDLVEGHLHT